MMTTLLLCVSFTLAGVACFLSPQKEQRILAAAVMLLVGVLLYPRVF